MGGACVVLAFMANLCSLVLVPMLFGGLCAAVSPLAEFQTSAVVTRVRQAETRIDQQLRGKSSGLDQIQLDVVAPHLGSGSPVHCEKHCQKLF